MRFLRYFNLYASYDNIIIFKDAQQSTLLAVKSTTINHTFVGAKRAQSNAPLILTLATVITRDKCSQVTAAATAV